jgi:3'-phosphoadenosine 5'-phosphosulfate sulfotransferase (PAPS reductase)/FAD synthetase
MIKDKNKLLVCMSGGRTSAYMTKRLIEEYSDKYEMLICFANTGQENDETLDFINECDNKFGFNTVWIESVVNDGRVACTHKIVDYESASRKGEPFEDVVAKYGLPNNGYPHCTRELKENPIHSYIKSIGWKKGEYYTALGIRVDEPRRIKRNKTVQNKMYPLVDLFPSDKLNVMDFWSEQEFDLQLHDYQGNCKWCYKKSIKKLFKILDDDVSIFNFPMMLEQKYGKVGSNKIKGEIVSEPRTLFRNYMSAEKMITLFNETNYKQTNFKFDDYEQEGCAESCEAFA